MKKLNYLGHTPTQGFMALYFSRAIIYIAIGFFGLFLPIFLYQTTGEDLVSVVIFFLATSTLYAILLPAAMRIINRTGLKRALIFGTLMGAGYLGTLGLMTEENWHVALPLTAVGLVVFRLAYWVPYHTDFAEFTSATSRGREISMQESTRSFIGIFTPLIAGAIIAQFGFGVLFLIVVILYIVAVFPLLSLPQVNETYQWGYIQTWRKFCAPKRRNMVLAYIANGAETGVGMVIWPIFLFILLDGKYFEIGALSAVIVAATIGLQLLVGKWADKMDKTKLLHIGSTLYAFGWIIKIFIATAFQIFLVDAYHRIMRIFMNTPFQAMTYDIAADEGHYIDEFTTIKEIAVHIGRVFVFALIILLFTVLDLPIEWIFAVAAVAAVSINILQVKHESAVK